MGIHTNSHKSQIYIFLSSFYILSWKEDSIQNLAELAVLVRHMEDQVGFSQFHSDFPSNTTDSFALQELPDNLLILGENPFRIEELDFEPPDPMFMAPTSDNHDEQLCDFDFDFDIDHFDPNLLDIFSSLQGNDESRAIGVEGVNEDMCLMMPAEVLNVEEEEEEEEESDEEMKEQELNCKNLLSERNRRKRLSQQLLELRALVPNITKMDKRSVLLDAVNYLRGVHEETARVVAELEAQTRNQNMPRQSPCNPVILQPSFNPMARTQILEIDTEKMEDRRFVVKVTSQGGGTGSPVKILRMIESLRFNITYAVVEHISPQHFLTMVFIKLRKHGKMTEVKINDYITNMSLRL